MKLTKLLSLILAVLMLLTFASCAKPSDDTPDTTPVDTTPTDTTPVDATQDTDATGEKNTLVMATNAYFPPYEFYEGETVIGVDAEIAAAIADKLGMELSISDMEFNSIISAVKSGAVDFGMAAMTIKPDRLEEVDFSVSYANGVQVIIVKEDSPITSIDDLFAEGANYHIGTQFGTTGYSYACDDFGDDNVVGYVTGNEAVLALAGDSVDCVIIDNEPAKAYVEVNAGLKILDTTYADEDYAICVSKDNPELLEKINAAILDLTEDGTIEGIIKKYIK